MHLQNPDACMLLSSGLEMECATGVSPFTAAVLLLLLLLLLLPGCFSTWLQGAPT